MEIGTLKGPDGTPIFVTIVSSAASTTSAITDLPEGAEPTGVADRIEESMERIKKTIASVVAIGAEALKQHGPSEWTIEFEIGFSGKVNPIPILVSSEAEAVLKISATWTKAG